MKRIKIFKSYTIIIFFVFFVIYSNIEAIKVYFFAALTFNIAVLSLFSIGLLVIFKAAFDVTMLAGTFGVLAYKKNNLEFYLQGLDKLMPANIAHMFLGRAKKGQLFFTAEESKGVVDWVDDRFATQNRYVNFFTSTVLMVGLMGTFSGLLIAIDDMGGIILSLTGDIDLAEVIGKFSGPLGGMAVGFGSSLFGVCAAIIMGIMGYILNRNHQVLIDGIEDWLKGKIIDDLHDNSQGLVLLGNNTDLAQQRKTFMDIFIESISDFTDEIKKLSLSNEKLQELLMSSIKSGHYSLEEQKKILNQIASAITDLDKNGRGEFSKIIDAIDEIVQKQRSGADNLTSIISLQETEATERKQHFDMLSKTAEDISKRLEQEAEQLHFLLTSQDRHIDLTDKSIAVQEMIKSECEKISGFTEKNGKKAKDISELLAFIKEQQAQNSLLLSNEHLKPLHKLLEQLFDLLEEKSDNLGGLLKKNYEKPVFDSPLKIEELVSIAQSLEKRMEFIENHPSSELVPQESESEIKAENSESIVEKFFKGKRD